MDWPKVWDSKYWKIEKNRQDFFLKTESGDRKWVGYKTVYSAIGRPPNKTEKVLELKYSLN